MTNLSRLRTALLGSGAMLALAAGPAFAGETDDLKAQINALQSRLDQLEKQQASTEAKPAVAPADAVVGGDFPGSFKLPGSDTSMAIHGFAKLDFNFNVDQTSGGNPKFFSPQNLAPNNSPKANQGLRVGLFPESSRFGFETRTPTRYGQLKTYIETDFSGTLGGTDSVLPNNSGGARIRHAYGELGPLLAGMTWELSQDTEARVEKFRANYIAGPKEIVERSPQVRLTLPYGKFTFAAAVEDPGCTNCAKAAVSNGVGQFFNDNAKGFGSSNPAVSNQQVEIPRIAGAVAYHDAWGHVRASGKLRQLRLDNGLGGDAGGNEAEVDKLGYEGNLSGDMKLGYFFPALGKDRIVGSISWETGVAGTQRPGDDSQSLTVLNFGKPNQRAFTNPSWGTNVGYVHWWTGNLRSSLAYGISNFHLSHDIGFANVDVTDSGQVTQVQEILANLLWSPVKNVTFALEYEYGEKHNLSNATGFTGFGSAHHLELGFQYFF